MSTQATGGKFNLFDVTGYPSTAWWAIWPLPWCVLYMFTGNALRIITLS